MQTGELSESGMKTDAESNKASFNIATLGKYELWLLLATIAIATFFHLLLQKNAGAFWRDECSSIFLARSKSWSDLFAGLFTDSFPALWVILLRFWDTIGGGLGPMWIRSIGFVLSMGGIASLWYAAKKTKLDNPILAIAIIAMNSAVFYWGDSLRAYALAMLLVVLLFAFVWRFSEEGGKKNFIIATILAILAAQSNYQSSYLILATCMGGAMVCVFQRRYWRGAAVIGIGFLAAASMIPYRPVIQQYNVPAKLLSIPGVSAALLWDRFTEGFGSFICLAIFGEFVGACLVLPFYFWSKRSEGAESVEAFHRSLFAATVAFLAPLACYVFARKAGFPTQCWYYIPLLGLMAIAIEMSLWGLRNRPRARKIRLLMAAVLVVASISPVWNQAHIRRTNMDLAMEKVSAASTKDLVLINPFWQVVSFQYYYTGKAPWSLLPVVPDDQRNLSYIATIPLMTSKEPLKQTYDRIELTLRAGGKVWVVGGLPKTRGLKRPETISAPHPEHGWQSWAFMDAWAAQLSWFMAEHSVNHEALPVKSDQLVSRFENVESIATFDGWADKK